MLSFVVGALRQMGVGRWNEEARLSTPLLHVSCPTSGGGVSPLSAPPYSRQEERTFEATVLSIRSWLKWH